MPTPTWKACFDESYDERWFITAAVLATKHQWRSLNSSWRKALAEAPAIPAFSMKDVTGREWNRSVFYRWSKTAVDKKVRRLTRVLVSATDRRLVVAFPLREFRHVMRRTDLDSKYTDPYLLGFIGALQVTADHMNLQDGRQTKPELVFDRWTDSRRQKIATEILKLLKRATPENEVIYQRSRWFPKKPLFLDDKHEVGLQAADLVAWHFRTAIATADRGGRPSIGRVLGRKVLGYSTWDRRHIDRWKWALKDYLRDEKGVRDRRTPWL